MTLLSTTLTRENCQYRAEGNASLVVRLKSFRNEPKVLRLFKEDVSTENHVNAGSVQKQLEDIVKICKNIMQPLLGENFIKCPFILPLSAEEVKQVNKITKNNRPSHRCNRVVKEANTYALVLPDYCSLPQRLSSYPSIGPVISIEIKPKQGFLKSDLFNSSLVQKPLLCAFCMKQYFKLQKQSISRSSYCPLDLFSGCPKRMQYAVQAMLRSPQNNIRIFKDGELVYSEEKRNSLNYVLDGFFPPESQEINLSTTLSELIVNTLLKSFASTNYCINWEKYSFKQKKCSNSFTKCSTSGDCYHELPEDCILYQILKLQMLDNLNTNELYSLYLETKKVNQNRQKIGVLPRCSLPVHIGEENQSLCESNIEFASRKVWEFLLALTFKDCSLMLAFKQLDTNSRSYKFSVEQDVVADKNGNNYLFSLGIIDLDMKTLIKVEAAVRKKTSIIETYLKEKRAP